MEQSSASDPADLRLQQFGEVILVVFGAYLASSVVVSLADPLLAGVVGPSPETNIVRIVQTILQFATMIGVVAWYLRFVVSEKLITAVVPNRRSVGLIGGGTVVLLGGQRLLNQLLQWADFSPGANQAVTAGAGDPFYFLALVPISLLLVGPAEELLFRGVVQGRLRESWGRWPAIIGATVLFGLIHIPAVTGGFEAQLSYALLAGVLGVVLGYLYEISQNIVVPAVVHGSYNGTVYLLFYLGEIGMIS